MLVDGALTGWRGVGVAAGQPNGDRVIQGVAADALQDSAHGGLGRGGRSGGFPAQAAEGDQDGGRCARGPLCDCGQGFGGGPWPGGDQAPQPDRPAGWSVPRTWEASGPIRRRHRHPIYMSRHQAGQTD